MSDFKILHLSSGEEIIGEVESEGDQSIGVLNPMTMLYISDEYGNTGMRLAKYILGSDNDQVFHFSNKHIICSAEPRKVVIDYYKGGIPNAAGRTANLDAHMEVFNKSVRFQENAKKYISIDFYESESDSVD